MFNLKFSVLLILFETCYCLKVNYCEICFNHTLCKYKNAGPSELCIGYDTNAVLTKQDIEMIVNKMNERRNLVASGRTRRRALPQAANMMKLSWSSELAIIAQRWVDQCDFNLQPDKRDDCRDTVGTKVGQNIATVMGLSPGLGVRSFVDIWFMQSMDYAGSVSYYNQSNDGGTDYYTQLIWADTTSVGCGRARFYIQARMPVDRLVCNFSPQGNVHARPVFNVGFPATQCPDGFAPDHKYTALCARDTFIQKNMSDTNLLQNLNSTYNSVTLEIDPIVNNLHYRNNHQSRNERNQKTRHVFNRSNSAVTPGIYPVNNRWDSRSFYPQRVYTRIHHESQHATEDPYVNHNRRYFRKCTRHQKVGSNDGQVTEKCTREPGLPNEHTETTFTPTIRTSTEQNTCNCYKSPSPSPTTITTQCTCDQNCRCLHESLTKSYFPTRYPSILRIQENSNEGKQDRFSKSYPHYQFPESSSQNGNHNEGQTLRHILLKQNILNEKGHESDDYFINEYNFHDPVQNKAGNVYLHKENAEHPRQHKSIYSSYRYRRESKEDEPQRPFWKLEDYKSKQSAHLKSLKYTTLADIRLMRKKRPKSFSKLTSTEPITIQFRESARPKVNRQQKPLKERYLSFDELMNLRRNNEGDIIDNDDGRRRSNPAMREGDATEEASTTTTTTMATSVEQINTYPRIRHCTRKLTCTWTAPTVSGKGIMILPGGSRTPPGFVDGCTRTSTCSRVYMDRNLMVTEAPKSSDADEDYCERRSLNVKRRESNVDYPENESHSMEGYSDLTNSTESYVDMDSASDEILLMVTNHMDTSNSEDGICSSTIQREKRKILNKNKLLDNEEDGRKSKERLTYGNLYYFVINKIIKPWKEKVDSGSSHTCACNSNNCFLYLFCKKTIIITLLFHFIQN